MPGLRRRRILEMNGWAEFFRSQRPCECGHARWAHPSGLRVRLLCLLRLRAACNCCGCNCYMEET